MKTNEESRSNESFIIALVGGSGAGKSVIAEGVTEKQPWRFGLLPGFMTRSFRKGEDKLNLEIVPHKEGRKRFEAFKAGDTSLFVNVSECTGTYYGNTRLTVDTFLKRRLAIKDLNVDGVINLRKAGYRVDVVFVQPTGHTPRPGREKIDLLEAARYPSLEPKFTVFTDHRNRRFDPTRCIQRILGEYS